MTSRELTPIEMVKIQLLSNSGINHNSSVGRGEAGGGGLQPPHWPVEYAKWHVFGSFEVDFCNKSGKSPPYVGMGNEYWLELSVKLQLI